jgi:hypothetical protein
MLNKSYADVIEKAVSEYELGVGKQEVFHDKS